MAPDQAPAICDAEPQGEAEAPAREEPIIELDDSAIVADATRPGLLPPGTPLGGYRIVKALGSGGMGCVYLAEHEVLRRKVAIKLLHDCFAHDPFLIERFFNEARAVNRIRNAHIVEVSDFVTHGGFHFFVMEYLEGRSLAVARAERGALAVGRVLHVMRQLADALAAAHEAGVVHRDLKPENVLLIERDEDPDFLKLLDFGIAKVTPWPVPGGVTETTAAGVLLGTPGYIAPEQILGTKVDHRADIYCFGVLLYELLAGRRPLAAATWPELLVKHTTEQPPPPYTADGDLPPRLVSLTMRCLEKQPDHRPASMREVKDELVSIARAPSERAATRALETVRTARATTMIVIASSLTLMATAASFALFAGAPRASGEQPASPVSIPATPPVSPPTETALTPASTPVAQAPLPAPTPKTSRKAPEHSERPARKHRVAHGIDFQLDVVKQLLKQKDFAQALELCEQLLKTSPRHALVHRHMGLALLGLKQKPQACEAFRNYLKHAPTAADRDRVSALLGGCP